MRSRATNERRRRGHDHRANVDRSGGAGGFSGLRPRNVRKASRLKSAGVRVEEVGQCARVERPLELFGWKCFFVDDHLLNLHALFEGCGFHRKSSFSTVQVLNIVVLTMMFLRVGCGPRRIRFYAPGPQPNQNSLDPNRFVKSLYLRRYYIPYDKYSVKLDHFPLFNGRHYSIFIHISLW